MRVSVICSDLLLHAGIQSLLSHVAGVAVQQTDGRLSSTANLIRSGMVDAVVISGDHLTPNDFAELSRLRSRFGFRIVAVSGIQDDQLSRELEVADALVMRDNGASGLQSAMDLLLEDQAPAKPHIQLSRQKPKRLTRREDEVVRLVAQGKSNRQIADVLGLREQSIKNLVSVIMRKLDCENRVQLALQFSAEPTKIAG